MILDQQWVFMEAAQPVIAGVADITTGTSISTNVYDQSPLDANNLGIIDFAVGPQWYLYLVVTTTADSSGDGASMNIRLVSSAAVGLGTPTVHWSTGVQVEATFAAGLEYKIPMPVGDNWLRYIGLDFVISGEDLTAFACTAVLTDRVDAWRAYAQGNAPGF